MNTFSHEGIKNKKIVEQAEEYKARYGLSRYGAFTNTNGISNNTLTATYAYVTGIATSHIINGTWR